MIKNLIDKLHNMPLWLINLLTLVSSVITILTPFFAYRNGSKPNLWITILFILFISILVLRVRKYRSLAIKRMQKTSESYHNILRKVCDTYFDVMQKYKKGILTSSEMTVIYKLTLSLILDDLCKILNSFTERKISACVKLFFPETGEQIDINNARLFTFCRSNTSTDRGSYEKPEGILLKDNTDFYEIVSPDNNKDYFYQGNLEKYDNQLKKIRRYYANTNKFWKDEYLGTIVVPIRIEYKLLYHVERNDAHHIIGFLCVDSLSKDAFTEQQEKYNTNAVKSVADIIYILLGQYQHYLRKFSSERPTET